MSDSFERNLVKFAEVITKVGVNLQPGQRLLIGAPMYDVWGAPIELVPLVGKIAEQAYQQGARLVDVLWHDESMQLTRFNHALPETLIEYPTWRTAAAVEAMEAGDAVIVVYVQNPSLLQGHDSSLISTFLEAPMAPMARFYDLRKTHASNCCLVSAPIAGWADVVLPQLESDKRLPALWDAIFDACRVRHDDPVDAWNEHLDRLERICDTLNRKQYSALSFRGPGTDLKVGLVEGHIWAGGRGQSKHGVEYLPNLPTEEVFTLPHREQVEGVVAATKPLHYGGALIQDFVLGFSQGRVVEVSAKTGEDFLREELGRDEGSAALGEVALVPHSSPISKLGLTFHNILLDENAACHLALGAGFRFNLQGGDHMSDDEFVSLGGNLSVNHLDFMIGSEEMEVDGVKDGTREPIMRSGEWAIA